MQRKREPVMVASSSAIAMPGSPIRCSHSGQAVSQVPLYLKSALLISLGRLSVVTVTVQSKNRQTHSLMCELGRLWFVIIPSSPCDWKSCKPSWQSQRGVWWQSQRGVTSAPFNASPHLFLSTCEVYSEHNFGQKGQKKKIEQNVWLKWEALINELVEIGPPLWQ